MMTDRLSTLFLILVLMLGLAPAVSAAPPAFGTLPGEFAIRTMLKNTYLTARNGGHHSIDAVVTSATAPGQNMEQGNCTYTIRTSNGAFIGVNQGGTNISTAIPNPATGANLGYSVYFELIPFL